MSKVPLDKMLEAIRLWDERHLYYPNLTKAAIGEKLDLHPFTVTKAINKRESIENRGRFEGSAPQRTLPKVNNTHADKPAPSDNQGETVLVIPDLHCPFQHKDALAFLKAVKAKYKPTKFLCLGDEVDFHALSRFPADPDGLSPGHELSRAIEELIPFYLEFPEMMVCKSNHTVRGHKKAFENGLPQAFLTHISRVLNAPDGWVWASKWNIDDVLYIHGEGKSGYNAHIQFMRAYRRKVVIGHIHSYAAVSHEGDLFAVNSGCLIDKESYCFRYADHMPIEVSLGCTVVHGGKRAEFIPLVQEAGRWVGYVS